MSILPIGTEGIWPGVTLDVDSKIRLLGNFSNPPSGLVVVYQLFDPYNNEVLSGAANAVSPSAMPGGYTIRAQVALNVPDALPVDQDYMVYWTATCQDPTDPTKTISASVSESFTLFSQEAPQIGLHDTVTIDFTRLHIKGDIYKRIGSSDNEINITLWTPDNVEALTIQVTPTVRGDILVVDQEIDLGEMWVVEVQTGQPPIFLLNPTFIGINQYTLPGDPTVYPFNPGTNVKVGMLPSLDPYMLHWSYDDDDTTIGTSQCWFINNIIDGAAHELKATMERGSRYPGLIESALTNSDYIQFLKMGRDMFNGIGEFTKITMTGAGGIMRRWWLWCAQYEAASSRELEEAIKAFDFSGLSTSLQVDISQAYEVMKNQMLDNINSIVVPAKKRLAIRGVKEGDGSDTNVTSGRGAFAVGATYSMVGNARFLFYGMAFGGLLGAFVGRVT